MSDRGPGPRPLLRVLLIEDDRDEHLRVRTLLERIPGARYEVAWASTFEEGVTRLADDGHDVCLLDDHLGERKGIELLLDAGGSAVGAPIVALTRGSDAEADQRLMRAGATDLLVKDQIDPEILERTIRYAIEHKRAEGVQRLLAQAGRALAASLDHDTTLGVAARIAVPGLADWAWVFATGVDGERRAVDAFHRDESGETLLRRLVGLPFTAKDSPLTRRVLEEASPRLLVHVSGDAFSEIMSGAEHRRLLSELDLASFVLAPMEIRGSVLGVLGFGRSSRRRPFDARDVGVAQELGTAVALALENARLYDSAQEAIRARNEVLSMVSHDLGNRLAAVVMVAERLLETVEEAESPKVRGHLEMIQSSSRAMVRMVSDLLEIGRAEAGHFTIERRPESLRALVERATRQFREVAERADIALRMELPPSPFPVDVDELRIVQVLWNLLSNAIAFTPPGGRVTVRMEDAGADVVVSIVDTGRGVDPEDLPRLFERFWQSRRTRRGGAGLGLTIAHEIVVAHGGRIWAESVLGEGSAFHFALPIKDRRIG